MHWTMNILAAGGLPTAPPDPNAPGHSIGTKLLAGGEWWAILILAVLLVGFGVKFAFSYWGDDAAGRKNALMGVLATGLGLFLVTGGGAALVNAVNNYLG
jgi:hypothetical protein